MKNMVKTVLVLGAVVTAASCIYLCVTYEPDATTLYFDTTSEHTSAITSSSSLYCFVFTGDRADSVQWDFGDGTSATGYEVIKEYDAGEHYITCTAKNMYGQRVSAYMLTVVPGEFGFWDGHETAIALMITSVAMMLLAYAGHRKWL